MVLGMNQFMRLPLESPLNFSTTCINLCGRLWLQQSWGFQNHPSKCHLVENYFTATALKIVFFFKYLSLFSNGQKEVGL